jgi:hypothetical protein
MIKQRVGFLLVAALLGVEPASAGSASAGMYPGQSQRSIDSGYCPGTLRHHYHLSQCPHVDQAGKRLAQPAKPNGKSSGP